MGVPKSLHKISSILCGRKIRIQFGKPSTERNNYHLYLLKEVVRYEMFHSVAFCFVCSIFYVNYLSIQGREMGFKLCEKLFDCWKLFLTIFEGKILSNFGILYIIEAF